ncbi:hypothetical protein EGM88_12665, partial [Aureibaculum marinum]
MCNQNLEEVVLIAGGSTDAGISVTNIYFNGPSGGGDFNDAEETISWIAGGESGGGFEDEEKGDQIDSDDLTGKEKCLNDLLDKNGDSFVKGIMKNFEGESEFDIKIISKKNVYKGNDPTNDEVNANCLPPKNNIITIQISTDKASGRPALSVARTILHEYIHADIFRKLKTKEPTSGDLDFRETYEKYREQFTDEIQHETMAALYIHSMRDALKDFHKNVLTTDYLKFVEYYGEAPADKFYEALAWQG